MSDSDDKHYQPLVLDLINDSPIADANPPSVDTDQFLTAGWSRILSKAADCFADSFGDGFIEF
jgi:hypothetical protein